MKNEWILCPICDNKTRDRIKRGYGLEELSPLLWTRVDKGTVLLSWQFLP